MANQAEQLISKGMGKAKASKVALQGLRGVFVTLAQEHGEAAALLKRCKSSSDPSKQAELWQDIRAALLSHERAEKKEVYSVLERRAGTKDMADHHDAEAQKMESMIARLDALGPSSEEWKAQFAELVDVVEHHATEEETEIFPKGMDVLQASEVSEMDDAYQTAKARELKQVR